jgi:glutaconate CoA-transferase subunit A
MTLSQVVSRLHDGMTIGIGGWGARRKPMALVREIVRSPLRDLTVVAYGGPDVGMLCAAGKVRKLVFGFVSLDLIPLDAHFRVARQAGAFETWEIDEGMLQWGCVLLPCACRFYRHALDLPATSCASRAA